MPETYNINLYNYLDPAVDPQVELRKTAMLRFSFIWLLLDQLPSGGWGKSLVPWMEANWEGSTLNPDITMEQEGGLESSVLSFYIYCHARNLFKAPSKDRNPEPVSQFRHYLDKHWDDNQKRYGMKALRQEGLVLVPSLRHTALGAYANLLINELYTAADPIKSLNAVFSAKHEEYKDERNSGMGYLVTDYLSHVIYDPNSLGFQSFSPDKSLKVAAQKWRDTYEPQAREVFLKQDFKPTPDTRVNNEEQGIDVIPYIKPYGGFWRMTSYTLLATSHFVTKKTHSDVKRRIAAGIEGLCKLYIDNFKEKEKRYCENDYLKPKKRSVYAWDFDEKVLPNDSEKAADIGTTSMLLALISNKDTTDILWLGSLPDNIRESIPLLHEDLIEQFDRYLLEPSLFKYTHATALSHSLLIDYGSRENIQKTLKEDEEYIRSLRKSEGLSERTLNKIITEKLFEIAKDLPTHIFGRSIARLLLDKTRPGLYAEGPFIFEEKNHGKDHEKKVIDNTISVYKNEAFAERFDQVWGGKPDRLLMDIFINMIDNGQEKRCLDAGCGPGQYMEILIKKGFQVYGLDISKPMLECAAKRLGSPIVEETLVEGNLIDLPLQITNTGPFDGIWCSGPMVHFPKSVAKKVIGNLKNLLSPDGVLMVNFQIGNQRLTAEDGRFYTYWHDREEIERLLSSSGLEIRSVFGKWIKENVYNEPNLRVRWDNFFCVQQKDTWAGPSPKETTTIAYDLITKWFIKQHENKPVIGGSTIDALLNAVPWKEGLILDAGCGPGHFASRFWEKGFNVVGLDLSPKMINLARQKFNNELSERKGSRFQIGDMCEVETLFEEATFEGIFCMAAFQHIPKIELVEQTLKGFWKILRPGGAMLLNVQIERSAGFEPDGRYTENYKNSDEVINWLKNVGFRDIKVDSKVTLVPKDNTFQRNIELKFVNVIAHRPRRRAFASYSQLDEKYVLEIKNNLADEVDTWRDIDDMPLAGDLHKEIKLAIECADYVLIFLSENSLRSKWVEWEIDYCLEEEKIRNINIAVPILLNVDSDKLPEKLQRREYFDMNNISQAQMTRLKDKLRVPRF